MIAVMAARGSRNRTQSLSTIEAALVRIIIARRQPRYRQRLADGAGIDRRVTTMRLLRAIDDLTTEAAHASIGEVADRLMMKHSNASRAVDHSVGQGLVVKRQASGDRRRIEVQLTDRGLVAVRELDIRREAVLDDLLQHWQDGDLHSLAVLLERLSVDLGSPPDIA